MFEHPMAESATTTDVCLNTPIIDISGSSSGNEDGPMQQQRPLHHDNTPSEAGLHRDGEQARLVEVVRRRQRQQRVYLEETTGAYFWESASTFWESILVYGGLIEDPRNDPVVMNRRRHHSTTPLNPYRDNVRSMNGIKPNYEQNGNRRETNGQPDDPLPPSRSSSLSEHFSEHPSRIIRFTYCIIERTLFALRCTIDIVITRMACLHPLLLPSSLATYSTSPIYTLHITADDILHCLIILWASFYIIYRTELFAGPVGLTMFFFIGFVSRKIINRSHSPGNQRQMQQQQQQNFTTTKQKSDTPNQSIATTKEQLYLDSILRLQKQHPTATNAECKRFFTCVKGKEKSASKRLGEFFKWRSDCGLETVIEEKKLAKAAERCTRVFDAAFVEKDEEDWNAAAKMAISIITKSHVEESMAKLPQIVCSYECQMEDLGDSTTDTTTNEDKNLSSQPPRCKDGTRILHILPFRLDLSIATAPTYSLAAALYLDRRFSRFTSERVTLFCDVRGGRGWANPTPWSTLPFVQSTASLLGSHYPERLERLVLFPMPKSAIWVWSAAQKCLDSNTASKVVVVSSAEGTGLPDRLRDYVNEDSLNILEERRRSFFVGSS